MDAKSQAELYVDLMGHDINNMNQIGMGYLELALDMLSLDENGRSLLSKPMSAFENSTRLIDNVRKLQRVKSGELLQYRDGYWASTQGCAIPIFTFTWGKC